MIEVNVKCLISDHPDHRRALEWVVSGRPPQSPDEPPSPEFAYFLKVVEKNKLAIDLLFGSYDGNELVAVCLGIEIPGRAMTVLTTETNPFPPITAQITSTTPTTPVTPSPRSTIIAAAGQLRTKQRISKAIATGLQNLCTSARQRNTAFIQGLIHPDDEVLAPAFRDGGFTQITQLLYLNRSIATSRQRRGAYTKLPRTLSTKLRWYSYSQATEPLFIKALSSTYVDSKDCYELTGMRAPEEVLKTHRATGEYDPSLWSLATVDDEPAGLLLLAGHSCEEALEIVYIGVASKFRGQGLSDSLIHRAIDHAQNFSARCLTLAVDRRNHPARRLYRRWDFVPMFAREAWIATPCKS